MTEATPQAEPWSVDPSVRFDQIHIIESLNTGFAGRSGRRLADELEALSANVPVTVTYHAVDSRDLLRAVMLAVVTEAESGHFPLLHLEAHGALRQPGRSTTSQGLILASGELLQWSEIEPYLVQINRATRLRLLVFVASCFGADIATLIRPTERAPMRVLIGPRDSISLGLLEMGTMAFYRSLFRDGDGGKALRDMNDATQNAFFPFTAEWMFLQILKAYYNEHTTPAQIAARVERRIAEMVLAGIPSAEISLTRESMRNFLADRKLVFQKHYLKFFFIDEHPEMADRFRMTFESCFEEAPARDSGA